MRLCIVLVHAFSSPWTCTSRTFRTIRGCQPIHDRFLSRPPNGRISPAPVATRAGAERGEPRRGAFELEDSRGRSSGNEGDSGNRKGGIRRRGCDPGRRRSASRVAGFTIELIEGFVPRGRSHPSRRRLHRKAGARGAVKRATRLKSQACRR